MYSLLLISDAQKYLIIAFIVVVCVIVIAAVCFYNKRTYGNAAADAENDGDAENTVPLCAVPDTEEGGAVPGGDAENTAFEDETTDDGDGEPFGGTYLFDTDDMPDMDTDAFGEKEKSVDGGDRENGGKDGI